MFPESVPLEDLFTEAVARLSEMRPRLCLAWLEEAGLVNPGSAEDSQLRVRIVSQRTFAALEHHDTDSHPDLMIEVYRSAEEPAGDVSADVVMIESKIGSKEGAGQLRRYAEHLNRMTGFGSRALVYITRGYDPKQPNEICSGLSGDISFKQLRWHDFYRFLRTVERDALTEEVMTFMEEQDMARSYRFSATDLIALSGVPRAFEIFDETLDGEVREELESLAGESVGLNLIRNIGRYIISAYLQGKQGHFYAGYKMRTPDGYPTAYVGLEAWRGAAERDLSSYEENRST